MIRDFIETVLGDAKGRASIWYRPKPGAKSPIERQKWFSYPEQVEQMAQFAAQLKDKDVYLPVAVFNEDKRVPQHATQVSSLWQDTDTFDPAKYRVQPSVIVRTSEGRTHCWFTLDKPYDAETAEKVVRKMTYAHKDSGADVSSWGRNKLLRVPGTTNTSHGKPQPVTVEYTGNVYTLQEIAEAYDDVPLPTSTPGKSVARVEVPAREVPDELPDFFEVQAKLPEDFPIELLTAEPTVGDGGNRSELRWRLLAELVEAGLTDEETFVMARQSPAASKWFEDRRGMDGLWAEILKERQRYEWGEIPEAEPAAPKEKAGRTRIELLTADERKRAKAVFQKTWIHEYEEWVKQHVRIFNPQYHRAAAWMALAQLVGGNARLFIDGNDVPLGLYFFVLGGTTSGKSQSKGFMRRVVHNGYPGDKNPDLGDDVSIGALQDMLRDREKQAGMMSSDEVDGMLNKMRDKSGWRQEDMSKYTDMYDGTVPPLGRKGQTEGKWTKVQFSWFGMGTEVKVVDALDRVMFESGFLARFQWWIGSRMEVSEEDLGVRFGGENNYRQQMEVIEAWRDRFSYIQQDWSMRSMGSPGGIATINAKDAETADFIKRLTAHTEKTLWVNDPNSDILKPSLTRTNITVAKFAALLALADGRTEFDKDDALIAFWQVEELLANLYYIAGRVASSDHAKQLDDLYSFIAKSGQDTKSAVIFRVMSDRYGWSHLDVERYRDELRAHGRLSYVERGGKHNWVATAIETEEK